MFVDEIYYDWTPESMIEVKLKEPDDFLKVKETLTRMGTISYENKTLWQSCVLLHKRGSYFIVHYKEMYIIDGNGSDLTLYDIQRRNTIAFMLQEWKLLEIIHPTKFTDTVPTEAIKVISFSDKKNWNCKCKYAIGMIKKSNGNY